MFFNTAYAGTVALPASEAAVQWDHLYFFLVWLSVFFFILVVGGMVALAYKYRARPGLRTQYITGSYLLETIWTVIPTLLLMMIFGWGYVVYNKMTRAPHDAMEIRVIGKQWLWQFQYDDGKVTTGELYVPVGKPVRLTMSSQDVIHSFFVPNFRVKQDVVPGMYTSVWFEATVPGRHQVFCAEYCGTSHSQMLASLYALDETQWAAFQRGEKIQGIPDARGSEYDEINSASPRAEIKQPEKPVSLVDRGRALSQAKGCVACHSEDGSVKQGPTFKGLFGTDVHLADGSVVRADDNYIRESIEKPQAKLVKNFTPVMPTFKGLVNEEEMNAIITFIKSLSDSHPVETAQR